MSYYIKIETLGKSIFRKVTDTCEGAGFTVALLFKIFYWFRHAWERRGEIFFQIYVYGTGSFLVSLLVAAFTGMILTLQVGRELGKFGQETNIGALVGVSMCREMGPVMTAIILAGLIGSKMAAELGTMKVSEEIAALEVMSINPTKLLIMPRFLALCIMSPVLTAYADIVGIYTGGLLVAPGVLHVSFTGYMNGVKEFLETKEIFWGLFKSIVFGSTTAVVSCAQGLKAEHGALGVGMATMKAVVISFVLILVFNYLLGWLYL